MITHHIIYNIFSILSRLYGNLYLSYYTYSSIADQIYDLLTIYGNQIKPSIYGNQYQLYTNLEVEGEYEHPPPQVM